jgi:hypothetical protein
MKPENHGFVPLRLSGISSIPVLLRQPPGKFEKKNYSQSGNGIGNCA